MKRDMDLVRKILLVGEATDGSDLRGSKIRIDDYDYSTVVQHIELLEEAGLVKASILRLETGFVQDARLIRLTWEGHEFLDVARNETVWNKTKKYVFDQVGGAAFGVMKTLLVQEAKQRIGIQ